MYLILVVISNLSIFVTFFWKKQWGFEIMSFYILSIRSKIFLVVVSIQAGYHTRKELEKHEGRLVPSINFLLSSLMWGCCNSRFFILFVSPFVFYYNCVINEMAAISLISLCYFYQIMNFTAAPSSLSTGIFIILSIAFLRFPPSYWSHFHTNNIYSIFMSIKDIHISAQ